MSSSIKYKINTLNILLYGGPLGPFGPDHTQLWLVENWCPLKKNKTKLEQLECLCSENTPIKFNNIAITFTDKHLLKLLDKMWKYDIDRASIVEDTEWTWFCPRTDRRTWNQYTPFNFVEAGV